MGCEWYLHRSRCPRCGQRFAGDSFILRSVALLTHQYRSCQNCGLSEEELAGEEVIHDS
jgi:ribosomal protein S27AE